MTAVSPTDALRSALRQASVAALILALPAIGAGWLGAGMPGVWGAVLGVAIAAGFLLVTLVATIATAKAPPTAMAAAVLGSWLAKMVVLFAVLFIIRDQDFYSRIVLFAVLVVTVVGIMVVQTRALLTAKTLYVDPTPKSAQTGTESDETDVTAVSRSGEATP
ncbi:hypothetical protein [Actinoalloteichus hymeniacidonis]|uniref:ATP synthase protein I n=1 Tax=Actinoalloteichus hymeniacidonis TaxID=340345 RepID=A0AAC9MWI9_9PSEU|nr:hypothetical protein [Actinoalloteichus hymeniacidonis]AOS62278.1 hypothetical protein TL08_07300 [Actinoalloteichus hymeniacidonis]MBB5909696.1 hypothetical protein [Actinoalloteichus hymeniacidonis]